MSFQYPVIPGELPPERSGHIAVHCNGYIIVWGGYHDIEATEFVDVLDRYMQMYHPSEELWLYNLETSKWLCMYISFGDIPPRMSGSSAVCVGSKLYLFAGHSEEGPTSKVYMLNLRNLEWQNITNNIQGESKPSPRDKLCCWQHNEFIVFFGGYGYHPQPPHNGYKLPGDFVYNTVDRFVDNRGWNNHVFVLDTTNLRWLTTGIKGTAPSPRAAHAAAKLGHKAYIFGGRFMDQRRNDLHYLDLDDWQWSGSLQATGCVPEGRTWHSLSPVSDRHLFLYGGFNNDKEALGDAYILDTELLMWSRITTPSDVPSSKTVRMWHTACTTSIPGEVLIFGGCSDSILKENSQNSDSIIRFRYSALSLLRLAVDAVVAYHQQLSGQLQSLPQHVLQTLLPSSKLLLLNLT